MQRWGLQVVVQVFGKLMRVASPQRLQDFNVNHRLLKRRSNVENVPLAMPIKLGIHLRRTQPAVGQRQHPVKSSLRERRR